ncbi:MAG: transcription termination factor Rho, partial [Anaerolineales bacterium]
LIYKLLDKQAVSASDPKNAAPEDKGKKKRVIKTSTANSTEEAIVESGDVLVAVGEPPAQAALRNLCRAAEV